ncbi:hypothetical protein GJ744_004063 [Endocarpon pusillum]|uniref:Uncharacterized protein n=1 Tax=Endocarpon pusillum TaxID=364733 RepID=A0A8H7A5X6_9EURO|nr:hypothetical protein GJ744_004063 [Endocarpon pusillum]
MWTRAGYLPSSASSKLSMQPGTKASFSIQDTYLVHTHTNTLRDSTKSVDEHWRVKVERRMEYLKLIVKEKKLWKGVRGDW